MIGLDLCPFARHVFDNDTVRYCVSEVVNPAQLLVDLAVELQRLVSASRSSIETTLLIHPHCLKNFLDYNDFLGVAETLLNDLDLSGVIQLIGFHPQFQFEGTTINAPENYTNRSPYPMLHLLRVISITEVSINSKTLLEIPTRNIETLKKQGLKKIQEKLKKCKER